MKADVDIFIKAVQSSDSLPPSIRELAAAAQSCERAIFDSSYLDFLREQIAWGVRGPEWSAILKKRLVHLAPYCDKPTLNALIHAPGGSYSIRVDPDKLRVIPHEVWELLPSFPISKDSHLAPPSMSPSWISSAVPDSATSHSDNASEANISTRLSAKAI